MHLEEERGPPSRRPPRGSPSAAEDGIGSESALRAPKAVRFREWVSG